MIENFEIKLVRMKNGEDLICFCFEDLENKKIHIKYPKNFWQNYDIDTGEDEIVIVDWLPLMAYAYNSVSVDSDQVLFTSYPTTIFGIRYLKELIDTLNPDSDLAKQINTSLEQYSDLESQDEQVIYH